MSLLERGTIKLDHNSEKHHKIECLIGDVPMVFEVGRVAKQAGGAVWVRWGDSVVLVTVCMSDKPRIGADFFPLTCEYVEKSYAAGRIPGGFFKREAKPSEGEIINSRIIDRSIRPLFPEGFFHEVQVIATVVSHDGVHDTDSMALCGASMALHVSDIPFSPESGPIAGVRVGRIDGQFVANPRLDQRQKMDVELMVAVSKEAIVMVEGGAAEATEQEIIDGLFFAHEQGQKVIKACEEMRNVMGKAKMPFAPLSRDDELFAKVSEFALSKGLKDALQTTAKPERYRNIDAVKDAMFGYFAETMDGGEYLKKIGDLATCFSDLKKDVMRQNVIDSKVRIDGRKYDEIRPIVCEVGVLPRAHGSSLFTRGETQALVSVTLGTGDDEQRLDNVRGESWRRFMLHYNFPPFSTGEAKMLRGTSRRELGHGALAERAVKAMVPVGEDFAYTLRVVSEILESNGSSSMASVCGAILALWDAGIKLKSPVAGIAMGLIKEGDGIAILSDILGDEDHLGDMDFKVCGTENGITAIQMDIKISGLSREILTKALEQARLGRLHILSKMKEALTGPREELSQWAPRIETIRINPDKIRDVIGPGGRMIRDICARSGAKVEITDDGLVKIAGVGFESVNLAKKIVEDLTREAQVNRVYKGVVKRVVDFGAFVELFPGTEGLVHVSELTDGRVTDVRDVVQEGDEVNVAVLSIDRDGKIRLSRKRAVGKQSGEMI